MQFRTCTTILTMVMLAPALCSRWQLQAKSTLMCRANEPDPDVRALIMALNICEQVEGLKATRGQNELNLFRQSNQYKEAIGKVAEATTDANKAGQLADGLKQQLPELIHSRVTTLEISAAIFGLAGAVVGGGLRLSKRKSIDTDGTWVGIGAGATGGGLTLTKIISGYRNGRNIKKKLPESVQKFILARYPRASFGRFQWQPSELQDDLDHMKAAAAKALKTGVVR